MHALSWSLAWDNDILVACSDICEKKERKNHRGHGKISESNKGCHSNLQN